MLKCGAMANIPPMGAMVVQVKNVWGSSRLCLPYEAAMLLPYLCQQSLPEKQVPACGNFSPFKTAKDLRDSVFSVWMQIPSQLPPMHCQTSCICL